MIYYYKRNNKTPNLLLGSGTNIDLQSLAARLELIGYGDAVPEETVPGHLPAHHSGQNRSRVQADPHFDLFPIVGDVLRAGIDHLEGHPCHRKIIAF